MAEQDRLIGVAVHVIGMGMQQSLQVENAACSLFPWCCSSVASCSRAPLWLVS